MTRIVIPVPVLQSTVKPLEGQAARVQGLPVEPVLEQRGLMLLT